MTHITFPFTLNRGELKLFLRYTDNKSEFYKISSKKIITFHGQVDGSANVSILFLFFWHCLGYSFICCYPRQVSERVRFGDFLWDEHRGVTSVSVVHTKDLCITAEMYCCSVENQKNV